MGTLSLWRGLKNPPANHPLYQRIMAAPPQAMSWYSACAFLMVAPLLLVPAMVFMSMFYSLRWAVVTSGTIAKERELGRFDLIAMSPAGAFGTTWAITSAFIHRNHSLEQIQSRSSWIFRLVFATVFLASVGNFVESLVPFGTRGALLAIIPLVYLFTLAAALYVDHLHSVAAGVLVGMLMPTYTQNRLDAGAGAFLMFLVVEIIIYTFTVFLGFSLLPTIFISLEVPSAAIALVLPFLRLGIFYLIGEGVIYGLWRILVDRLNVSASEVESMTHP